jgi:hypothetical protein
MISKVLRVFIIKCKAARRWNCEFNAKLVLSTFFLINLITLGILILGREDFFMLIPEKRGSIYVTIGIITAFYVTLSVLCPKHKLYSIELKEEEIKKIFKNILIYIFLTPFAFIISAIVR